METLVECSQHACIFGGLWMLEGTGLPSLQPGGMLYSMVLGGVVVDICLAAERRRGVRVHLQDPTQVSVIVCGHLVAMLGKRLW